MSNRTPLQQIAREMAIAEGIDPDILDAADHPRTCRCEKCLKYWAECMPTMPEDGDEWDYEIWMEEMEEWGNLCPFTEEEVVTKQWTL